MLLLQNREVKIKEDLVAQWYPAHHGSLRIALQGRECIADDPVHAKRLPLVETQIVGIGGRGRDDQPVAATGAAVRATAPAVWRSTVGRAAT